MTISDTRRISDTRLISVRRPLRPNGSSASWRRRAKARSMLRGEGLDCIPDLVRAGAGDGIFECRAGQRAALCDRFRSQHLHLRHVCRRVGFQQRVPELRGGSMPGLITARVRQLSRCCARARLRPNACKKHGFESCDTRAAGAQARSFSKPNISAQTVKELREKTGSPMMDCKRALEEVAHMHAAAHLWFPSSRLCSACRASFWAFMRLPACANTPICAYMRGAHICLHLMLTPGACVCLCIVCSPTETCKAPSTFCAKRAWQLLPKRSICLWA